MTVTTTPGPSLIRPSVAVPLVEGSVEPLAVQKLQAAGLRVRVRRLPHDLVTLGHVYNQSVAAGARVDSGTTVTILVSAGHG